MLYTYYSVPLLATVKDNTVYLLICTTIAIVKDNDVDLLICTTFSYTLSYS